MKEEGNVERVIEIETGSEEARQIVETLMRELCEALNKAMASGMPAEACATALDGFSKDLHSAPPGASGKISLYRGDGHKVAGEDIPPEKVKAALAEHAAEAVVPGHLEQLSRALDAFFNDPDIAEALEPRSPLH